MSDEIINLKELKILEFCCKKCKTRVIFDFTKRKKMLRLCPNCGDEFIFNTYTDPIKFLCQAIDELNQIENLEVSFVKDENE